VDGISKGVPALYTRLLDALYAHTLAHTHTHRAIIACINHKNAPALEFRKIMNSLFQSLFLAVVVTMSSTQAMASAHVRKLFQVGPDVTVAPHREYIVTFDKQAVHNAAKKVEQLGRHDDWKSSGVQVIRTYEAGLKGVALRHATDDVLELLERDPHVQTIEPVGCLGCVSLYPATTNL
jgi:Peptidase inhibitor I9